MLRTGFHHRWLAILGAALALVGQPAPAGAADAAQRKAPPIPPALSPPRPPPAPTPVDRFRDLLARDAAGREQVLTNRSPEQAEYLRARLAEFDALPRDEREARLQLLTVRHYLIPLLGATSTNRTDALRQVPQAYRATVKDRLEAWDALAAEQQREMLASGSLFTEMPLLLPRTAVEQRAAIAAQPAARRDRLEADFARWQSLPEETRQRVTDRFQELLSLDDHARHRALARLDETNRVRAQRVVQSFAGRPPEQQAQLVEALKRFNALPPAERERFLRNAARWESMSTAEQHAWRRVTRALPPSPPGLNGADPGLPPQPPALTPAPYSSTNAQASR